MYKKRAREEESSNLLLAFLRAQSSSVFDVITVAPSILRLRRKGGERSYATDVEGRTEGNGARRSEPCKMELDLVLWASNRWHTAIQTNGLSLRGNLMPFEEWSDSYS
jgi:hypothetical protein